LEQRMSNRFGFWIAHLNILVVCGVLAGAFVVQFGGGEFPCPLCVLQRMAMMLCALGPAYVIMKAREGEVKTSDFATGYGMSVLAAVGGACISIRQILLHIVPPDPGYGDPVFGLHLYTWALLVFVAEIVAAGVNLVFVRELEPREAEFGWPSRLVLLLLGAIIAANAVAVFAEEGLHWTLPDDPNSYQLFDLLRG
jgi:disulfide bond formation protein DsbB